MQLIIISGRSGSGKSVALDALEDIGYYCIDNLPLNLLPALPQALNGETRMAVSMDARNIRDPAACMTAIQALARHPAETTIIFLDADAQTLARRFSETRRKHPLNHLTLQQAIEAEQDLLAPVIDQADIRIDTRRLSVRELRQTVYRLLPEKQTVQPQLIFRSFSYRNSLPDDSDFVFDVRCLPNPYWQSELRDKTGLDEAVIVFFARQPKVQAIYDDIKTLIEKWLPIFCEEGRKYLTVAVGCTGGQHRSVYLAQQLGTYFAERYPDTNIIHREIKAAD